MCKLLGRNSLRRIICLLSIFYAGVLFAENPVIKTQKENNLSAFTAELYNESLYLRRFNNLFNFNRLELRPKGQFKHIYFGTYYYQDLASDKTQVFNENKLAVGFGVDYKIIPSLEVYAEYKYVFPLYPEVIEERSDHSLRLGIIYSKWIEFFEHNYWDSYNELLYLSRIKNNTQLSSIQRLGYEWTLSKSLKLGPFLQVQYRVDSQAFFYENLVEEVLGARFRFSYSPVYGSLFLGHSLGQYISRTSDERNPYGKDYEGLYLLLAIGGQW